MILLQPVKNPSKNLFSKQIKKDFSPPSGLRLGKENNPRGDYNKDEKLQISADGNGTFESFTMYVFNIFFFTVKLDFKKLL